MILIVDCVISDYDFVDDDDDSKKKKLLASAKCLLYQQTLFCIFHFPDVDK